VRLPATPQDDTRAARRRALLRDVVADLPEAQAEALILRSVLGYSFEEVAAATGAPLNTVRSRLRLAKEALRRRIETDARFLELLDREEP
jgi:RNA polymerase sigma-70 factor (ECF subfamily)